MFLYVHLSFSVHVFKFPSVTVCFTADTSCGITQNVAFIEEVKKWGKGGGGWGGELGDVPSQEFERQFGYQEIK